MRSDTSSVIQCAPGALYAHRSNRSPSRIGPGLYFRFHTSSIPPTPYFLFCKSIPVFGIVAVLLNDNIAAAVSGCGRHSSPHAQPLGPGQRHGRRPCDTGSRRPRFVCRGQPAAAAVPFHIAPRARRVATSGGPAGCSSDLGAEGHGFFLRRFLPAMRRSFRNQ